MAESLEMDTNRVICGNCLEVMLNFPDASIGFFVTSPPYEKNIVTGRESTCVK